MEHAVDDDAEGLAADLSNDDKSAFDVAGGFAAEQITQSRQRQQLVAQTQHRGVLDAFDAVLAVAARPHKLDHRKLRDGIAVAAGFDDQRGDNRERERDLDGETQTHAGNRFDVDGAADLVDIVAHHIHADAAAGYAGDFGGGREAGCKYEFVDLRFRQLGDLGLGDEALGNRLGLDALGVETAAVIGDLNDNVAAFVIGRKPNAPRAWLAGGAPLLRRFQTVVGGIAHHVRQRVLDQIEHLAIKLGLGALHFQFDRLAEFVGEIAHDARKFLPGIADRLHARLHHAFLQLGGDIG